MPQSKEEPGADARRRARRPSRATARATAAPASEGACTPARTAAARRSAGSTGRARRALAALATAVLVAAAAGAGPGAAGTTGDRTGFDRGLWGELLARYTTETDDTAGTRVDYAGLRHEPRWRTLIASVEAARPSALHTRAERIAWWIDVYNVLAIDTVVRHYPVDSIRDVGSFLSPVWKRTAATIEGRPVSLGEIEHRTLRPMGEPRIHAAIVCASTSCPPLARTPFLPSTLDAQLDAQVRRWLASPTKGVRIERAAGRIWLSPIFSWFEGDFERAGGVLAFVARYVSDDDRAWIEAHAEDAEVDFFDYDWSLNDWRRSARR